MFHHVVRFAEQDPRREEGHHRAPFGAGETRWSPVHRTPWYSMMRKGDWFSVSTTSGRDPVSALVVDAQLRVLLVEIYRPAIDRVCLETPRGFLDAGERPRDGALREMREETGVSFEADRGVGAIGDAIVDLGRIAPDSGILGTSLSLFEVRLGCGFEELGLSWDADGRVVVDGDDARGDGEARALRVLDIKRVWDLLASGTIADGVLAMSLLRFEAAADLSRRHGDPGGVSRTIEIVDGAGRVLRRIETDRPDWSFQQFVREREGSGLRWRFAT